jgi:hypothetical protein
MLRVSSLHLSWFKYLLFSWCSEGKPLGLLRREDVVPVQISNGPYDRNAQKRDGARTVVDRLGKGKHDRYPPDNIVGNKDKSVTEALFDWNVVT